MKQRVIRVVAIVSTMSVSCANPSAKEEYMKMQLSVNGHLFTATMADNKAARNFYDMAKESPISIRLQDYSGFEKVGPLDVELPRSDRQTSTQASDIMLYAGDQIVVFYGSHSWSYTRLGKVDDLDVRYGASCVGNTGENGIVYMCRGGVWKGRTRICACQYSVPEGAAVRWSGTFARRMSRIYSDE